jgi:hypothetical protein
MFKKSPTSLRMLQSDFSAGFSSAFLSASAVTSKEDERALDISCNCCYTEVTKVNFIEKCFIQCHYNVGDGGIFDENEMLN